MHIAIIGAGFTGLSAAYRLAQSGHQVDVFEKEFQPGGLAVGFKSPGWDWTLEKHYHHLFVSDSAIRNLAAAVNHPITFSRPTTSTWISGRAYQFDSALSVLKFPLLSPLDRLRTGASMAFMKFNPFWQMFEGFTAKRYLETTLGDHAWQLLWRPLLEGKFGHYYDQISAAWFWARIYKRSAALGYPDRGFQALANSIEQSCRNQGVSFTYSTSVTALSSTSTQTTLHLADQHKTYDRVISTLPFHLLGQLHPQFKSDYSGFQTDYLGAVTLVLTLTTSLLPDGTYWLNINDPAFPFLSVVEHTNFISASHYSHQKLVYVGNYLPTTHPYFQLDAKQLAKIYLPFLRRINPSLRANHISASWVWKAPFAQPIITPHYSRIIPPLTTSLPHVYSANMQQVYPWDRGTNYAVELGQKVAQLCLN